MIGSASAGISHLSIDVGVRGLWLLFEQRHCCQDLPRLAVATLRDIKLFPGELDRVRPIGRQPFDSGDLPADGPTGLQEAGPHRHAIDQDGAGATLADAATVLCAGETDRIPEHPQQRRFRFRVHGILDAIDEKSECHIGTSLIVRNPTGNQTVWFWEGGESVSNAAPIALVFYHLASAASS